MKNRLLFEVLEAYVGGPIRAGDNELKSTAVKKANVFDILEKQKLF